MCDVLYIGLDEPFPAVDSVTAINMDMDDAFHLETIDPADEYSSVVNHFSKPYVYYAASSTHCGCGFFSAIGKKSRHSAKQDNQELKSFLEKQIERGNFPELFLGWDGKKVSPIEKRVELSVQEFGGENLPLSTGDLVSVTT